MTDYHLAWLAAHPRYDAEWLASRLKEGFDIHHLDGDHSNNHPDNLVLIEHSDHMMLHKTGRHLGRFNPRSPPYRTWRKIYTQPIGPMWHWRFKGKVPKVMGRTH